MEIELSKIRGIDEEERDDSVGCYIPFCIVGEDENGKQVSIYLDYDVLINLGLKLKPFLDDYKAREEAETEFYKEYLEGEKNGD